MHIASRIFAIGLIFLGSAVTGRGAASAEADGKFPAKITPGWLKAEIQARGAKDVVTRLFDSNRDDEVADMIGTGQTGWLDLVPLYAPGTDGGPAEGLTIGLAHALPRNAAGVLKAVKLAKLDPRSVCGAPFFDNDPADTPAYYRRSIKAVSQVRDDALAVVRDDCLTALAQAKDDR
jgi:hypothetical protein